MAHLADSEAMHAAVRLRAAISQLMRGLRAAGAAAPVLSAAKLSVLAHLHRNGPATPTALAQLERVKLQSLTRLLAELEAERLIVRETREADRRQSVLTLTRSGARLLGAEVQRREAALGAAISGTLSAGDRARLLEACVLIERVAEAVGSTEPSPVERAT